MRPAALGWSVATCAAPPETAPKPASKSEPAR